jgi:predicted alpha/beta hydrolase
MMLLPLALAAAATVLPACTAPSTAATPPISAVAASSTSRDITKILNTERGAHASKLHPFATTGNTYVPLKDVFPVGKAGGYAVDSARGVAARSPLPAASTRTLPIEIWYPASSGPISSTDTFWAIARNGHFPLVVFAPGFNANPDTYQPFLHAIAAQGFIVAAPVFPIEASIDGAAPASRSNTEILNQMYDMSAVISQMLAYARQPGNFLGGAMSQTQIGVIGHSDGAMTVAGMTMSTSYSDPRIKAAIVMNGAGPMGLTWNKRKVVPTMVEQATGDPYNAPSNSQWLFGHVAGSRDYLSVSGPYHIWPLIGDDKVSDLVRRSVITNLDLTLKSPGWPTWWAMVAAANTPGYTALKFAAS